MNDIQQNMGLLAQIARGLVVHGMADSSAMLGDRTEYIGMSDTGRSAECMRVAVADKVFRGTGTTPDDISAWYSLQNHARILTELQKQLVLQRGHWIEAGMADILMANGSRLIRQLEISIINESVPVKAHLDFTLLWGGESPSVRILEIKSTEHIPETLYSSYEIQLYGQLGMLSEYWNSPCFSLRDKNGKQVFSCLTFPEVSDRMFGIKMPEQPDKVDIQGWVLCIGMSDIKAFGAYTPDFLMSGLCQRLAEDIWNKARAVTEGRISLNEISYCQGFHPLCGWCDYSATCPKFQSLNISDTEYDAQLLHLENLKSRKSSIEKEIDVIEDRIGRHYRHVNPDGRWLDTGSFRFRVSDIKGRTSLDRRMLEAELSVMIGDEMTSELMNRVTSEGRPYQRLYINRIKK